MKHVRLLAQMRLSEVRIRAVNTKCMIVALRSDCDAPLAYTHYTGRAHRSQREQLFSFNRRAFTFITLRLFSSARSLTRRSRSRQPPFARALSLIDFICSLHPALRQSHFVIFSSHTSFFSTRTLTLRVCRKKTHFGRIIASCADIYRWQAKKMNAHRMLLPAAMIMLALATLVNGGGRKKVSAKGSERTRFVPSSITPFCIISRKTSIRG